MPLNQFLAAISILYIPFCSRTSYARPNKALPDLFQGNFSADGATLTLSLSEQYLKNWHARAAKTLVCDELFVNSDQLLGPRAVCRLRGRLVNIILGPGATIQPTLSSASTDKCLPGATQPLIFREKKPKRQLKSMAASVDTGIAVVFCTMNSVVIFCNFDLDLQAFPSPGNQGFYRKV